MNSNPLDQDEDFWIPVITPVRVAPVQSQIEIDEDVAYFLKNLYAALKIPKEFQSYESQAPTSEEPPSGLPDV